MFVVSKTLKIWIVTIKRNFHIVFYYSKILTARQLQKSKTHEMKWNQDLDAVVEEQEDNITDHEMNNEEDNFVEPRKARAASAGMADLMKSLKPKKRGQWAKLRIER